MTLPYDGRYPEPPYLTALDMDDALRVAIVDVIATAKGDTYGLSEGEQLEALRMAVAAMEEAISVPRGKRHRHVNKGNGTDVCAHCGLDLRDEIHWRSGEGS